MTEDYEIITAGKSVKGRSEFKAWVQKFQGLLKDAKNKSKDILNNSEHIAICLFFDVIRQYLFILLF